MTTDPPRSPARATEIIKARGMTVEFINDGEQVRVNTWRILTVEAFCWYAAGLEGFVPLPARGA